MYLYISLCFDTRLLGRLWFPRSTKSYEEVTLHSHPGPLSLQQHTISSVTFSHPWTDSTDSQHQVVDSTKTNKMGMKGSATSMTGLAATPGCKASVTSLHRLTSWRGCRPLLPSWLLGCQTQRQMRWHAPYAQANSSHQSVCWHFKLWETCGPLPLWNLSSYNYWWLSLGTLLIFWSGRLNDAVCKMVPVICGAANMRAVIIPHPSTCVFHSVPHDDTAQLSMEWFKGKSWKIDHLQEGFYPHWGGSG